MATIAENLQRIVDAKASLKTSIESKGVAVPTDARIEAFPALVDAISQGGGYGGNIFTGHLPEEGLKAKGFTEQELARIRPYIWWNEEDDAYWGNLDKYVRCTATQIPTNGNLWVVVVYEGVVNTLQSRFTNYHWVILDFTNCSFSTSITNLYFGFYAMNMLRALFMPKEQTTLSLTNIAYGFQALSSIEILDLRPFLGAPIPNASVANTFLASSYPRYILGEIDAINASMAQCRIDADFRLQEIRIKNLNENLNLSSCYLLSHDSIMYMLNHLVEGTHTLTLGAVNLAKLTDEEKAIATSKGWTLA